MAELPEDKDAKTAGWLGVLFLGLASSAVAASLCCVETYHRKPLELDLARYKSGALGSANSPWSAVPSA